MKIFSDISLWFLVPAAMLAVSGAVIYYRKQEQLNELRRWERGLLTTLRSISLFLIIVLLFGLLFESKESRTEKPLFINLIDNSGSMKNYSDSALVSDRINGFHKALNERYGDRFEIRDYYLDEGLQDTVLNFKGKLSDLDQGFELVYNQFFGRNIGGICLISDGNYNAGSNPLYTAERIRMTPVFTLGVGDTITKKDQKIRNVLVNTVAFLGNQFPVEVELEADRMPGVNTKVKIMAGGQMIAEKNVVYSDESKSLQKIDFLLDANQSGFIQYKVVLEHWKGEVTFANNEQSFFIEVIDTRSKVLILSEAPHPDESAIKQVLEKDDKLSVESDRYDDWGGDLKDVKLVIAHGFHSPRSKETLKQIKKKGIPVFFLAGLETDNNDLKAMGISLQVPSGDKADEVQGYINPSFQLFELSEELVHLLEKAPPVNVRFGNTSMKGGEMLIGQRLGSVKKGDPLLFFGGGLNTKYAVFAGEGLWRWKLYEYQRSKENKGFNDLIRKITQYLIVKSDKDPFRILLPGRFNETKDIIINAEFYNASMESITEPDAAMVVTDDKGRNYNFQFSKNRVDYSLNIGKLPAGKYSWKASTSYDNRQYRKEGQFVVEHVELEAKSMSANYNLLFQLADRTNGSFYPLMDYNRLLDEIGKRKDIVNVVYEESSFKELIDIVWLLVCIAILLSAEWFFRRWKGSY